MGNKVEDMERACFSTTGDSNSRITHFQHEALLRLQPV